MRPIPQGHFFQLGGPRPARPTLGSQLPRFSSRREKREGERQGCACVLLPPLPSAGPFPPRQETSPDSQPAAALPAPPSTPDPRSHTPQGGRSARSSAPLLNARPEGRASPGAAPAHRPLLLPPPPHPPPPPPGLAPHSPTLAQDGVTLGGPDKRALSSKFTSF